MEGPGGPINGKRFQLECAQFNGMFYGQSRNCDDHGLGAAGCFKETQNDVLSVFGQLPRPELYCRI